MRSRYYISFFRGNFYQLTSHLLEFKSIRSTFLDFALRGKDIYLPHFRLNQHDPLRRTISLVLLDHIYK